MSETEMYAAQGAMSGFSAGGIPGAIIGFGIGAIAGDKAKAARKAANRASNLTAKAAWLRVGIQRRDMVRNYLFSRGLQLSSGASEDGADESSTFLGAKGSTSSQFRSNMRFFDNQVSLAKNAEFWYNKAGQNAANAQNVASLGNLIPMASYGLNKFQSWYANKQSGFVQNDNAFQPDGS